MFTGVCKARFSRLEAWDGKVGQGRRKNLGKGMARKKTKQQETEWAGTNSEDHDGHRNASEKPE